LFQPAGGCSGPGVTPSACSGAKRRTLAGAKAARPSRGDCTYKVGGPPSARGAPASCSAGTNPLRRQTEGLLPRLVGPKQVPPGGACARCRTGLNENRRGPAAMGGLGHSIKGGEALPPRRASDRAAPAGCSRTSGARAPVSPRARALGAATSRPSRQYPVPLAEGIVIVARAEARPPQQRVLFCVRSGTAAAGRRTNCFMSMKLEAVAKTPNTQTSTIAAAVTTWRST